MIEPRSPCDQAVEAKGGKQFSNHWSYVMGVPTVSIV